LRYFISIVVTVISLPMTLVIAVYTVSML